MRYPLTLSLALTSAPCLIKHAVISLWSLEQAIVRGVISRYQEHHTFSIELSQELEQSYAISAYVVSCIDICAMSNQTRDYLFMVFRTSNCERCHLTLSRAPHF